MRDGRGIGRFFTALFAALGSLIIPKRKKRKKEAVRHSFMQLYKTVFNLFIKRIKRLTLCFDSIGVNGSVRATGCSTGLQDVLAHTTGNSSEFGGLQDEGLPVFG